ncbi:hypothetical protein BJ166DRAFT_514278 [Pestalotiopsis sp. NC0098]|nr:hypothetical protein BJ166DRAFT_514278 [Pestalotiopsis sp. NC0098]
MAGDSTAKTTLQSDSEGYTRLHITPLDAELLKVVVPAAVLPQARNISYHTIETFPDKRYGFVELPTADADKLRKKLNGATLKGSKVRIDQARPESIHQPSGAMENAKEEKALRKEEKRLKKEKKKQKEKSDKTKKRKWEPEVVEGVQIDDRKIKRGWTVTESDKIQEKRKEKSKKSKDADGKKDKKKEKKREVKSKYTDAPECLFKQKLPEPPSESKKAKDDEEEDEPKRKKRRGDRQVVVHEFEKTHKYPTFLKSTTDSTSAKPLTFDDTKGWVDEEGNVVEAQKITRPSFAPKAKAKVEKKRAAKSKPVEDDDTSSSGSSSDSDSDSDEAEVKSKKVSKTTTVAQPEDDTTSSSGSSSDDDSSDEEPAKASPAPQAKPVAPVASKKTPTPAAESDDTSSSNSSSDDESDSEKPAEPVKKQKAKELIVDTKPLASPAAKLDSARPKSSGSAASLTIQIPPVTPAANKVHPLEALYKRPAGTEPAPDAGFSFFGNEDDIEEDADGAAGPSSQPPMTPFSKQDFEVRGLRSAAPTPDTAHPSRSYNLWPRDGEDDIAEEDEEDDEGQDADEDAVMADATTSGAADKSDSKSEFQNWFWEHRGDLNRSWKKRRKTASKEKRNRENRARAARAI